MFPHTTVPFEYPPFDTVIEEYNFRLMCVCRTPWSPTDPLSLGGRLKCISCNISFHEVCVGLPKGSVSQDGAPVPFRCRQCAKL